MSNLSRNITERRPYLSAKFLQAHLDSFVKHLHDRGFRTLTIECYIDSVSHFGTWLSKKEIALEEVDSNVVDKFAKHLCYCPGARRSHSISGKYVKRVQSFVCYLIDQGVIHEKSVAIEEVSPLYLSRFCDHLCSQGLSQVTIDHYRYCITKLIPLLGDIPERYSATKIKRIIYDAAKQWSIVKTKKYTTALRVYLRFLAINGLCRPDLNRAVPAVPQWKLSSIPRYITGVEIERVIAACNVQTNKGLRDKAIILLLARLGLRAGDIVHLQMSDIDWTKGALKVRGKGQREDKLPLPQDVGDAILAYIEKARPAVAIKQVFLCLNAPYRPFTNSSTISSIVDTALTRAKISDPPSRGAHLLRHTVATSLLRSGVSLETVSSILRHRSFDMTAYYAKVDIPMLLEIAQPWPEGGSC